MADTDDVTTDGDGGSNTDADREGAASLDDTTEAALTAALAATYKVLGEIDASDGAGVLGRNLATTGDAPGVTGTTDSPDGYGLATPDDARVEGTLSTVGEWLVTSNDRRLLLHTAEDPAGDAGNVIAGHSSNAVEVGAVGATVAGGGFDDGSASRPNRALDDYATVGGGQNNFAGQDDGSTGGATHGTVAGGRYNIALNGYGAVGGGRQNWARGFYATIPGGQENKAYGLRSTVAGGYQGVAIGEGTAVGGGEGNDAWDDYATVGGGLNNAAGSDDSGSGSTTGQDTTNAPYATVGGGRNNVAEVSDATVAGGQGNKVRPAGFWGTIGGGQDNVVGTTTTTSDHATVGGGEGNTAFAQHATIGGGEINDAEGLQSTIGGGQDNRTTGTGSTIGGGLGNAVTRQGSTVAGGQDNTATGQGGAVVGGRNNDATGLDATVAGGRFNDAGGARSFAAGYYANASQANSFVWAGDGSRTSPLSPNAAEQFIVEAPGGVGIGTADPDTQLHVAASRSGLATPANHVALIENTSGAGSEDVLALKMAELEPPEAENNYISFKDGNNNSVGAIQGDGTNSVVLAGENADYAEWLPRRDPAEEIDPGDVVGVHAGEISLETAGADRVMVASVRPIVTGNDPGPDPEDREGYDRVAFVGQVPVTVEGPVESGDLVVPSGDADGLGRAVDPDEWTREDGPVVGQAWGDGDPGEDGTVEVTVAVGLGDPGTGRDDDRVADLERENDTLRERNDDLAQRLAAVEERLGTPEAGTWTPADD